MTGSPKSVLAWMLAPTAEPARAPLAGRAAGPSRGLFAAVLAAGCVLALFAPVSAAEAGEGFPKAIQPLAAEGYWLRSAALPPLTRKLLVDSIEAARVYLLNQQLPEGHFVYGLGIVTNTPAKDDSQVRQAGALWGLASLGRDRHTTATRSAVVRGLDFFFRCSQPLKLGCIAPVYPGEDAIDTGTVALTALAIVELCRGQDEYLTESGRGLYDTWLTSYLGYLQHLELEAGGWGQRYLVVPNEVDPEPSPYFDGETLLLYCRAARYLGRRELIPRIERQAPLLAQRYTTDAWAKDPGSDLTKGFAHWGCLAFAECVEAEWANAEVLGDAAMALAWWLVHRHGVEARRANTGYAVEGLLAAYRIARQRGDTAAMQSLRAVCERLLVRLITMQVGGPLQDRNHYLSTVRTDPKATGGILSFEDSGFVRIDTVQHQLHAMLLAVELLFPETETPTAVPGKATGP
jgi:hypothetical protein